MELSIDELRLLRRAIRYSVAHLNVCSEEARDAGRVREKLECQAEASRLLTLSEVLHEQLKNQLGYKKLADSIAFPTGRTEGCGAECSNLCAAGACPRRQSV